MKFSIFLTAALFLMVSCNPFGKTVSGNGNVATENRTASIASKIDAAGIFNIVLITGNSPEISVRADENLLPYILTEFSGNELKIRAKDGYSLRPSDNITIRYTTRELSDIELAGSCNVTGEGKFIGNDDLKIELSGTGNVKLEVNYPQVESKINGSGDVNLSGETRDSKISISGVGNYNAGELKSENVRINIAGSGNAAVYASANLDVNIAGTGNVDYYGNPQINQKIAGSGKIKKLD